MEYKKTDASNINDILCMAILLWNDHDIDDLKQVVMSAIEKDDNTILICFDNNNAVGFAMFSIRNDYVEGTSKRPVGYLEGIFVKEQWRGKGVARELINKGEVWAVQKGCRQMASDCELNNTNSLEFHLKCGFSEANRIICFVKDIKG